MFKIEAYLVFYLEVTDAFQEGAEAIMCDVPSLLHTVL